MRLARLEIQTLPGIEPGFTLENIAPGINMVTGPNAVGKSSLIRALGYLVGEPRSNDPLALSLTAVFEGDEGRWTVRRTGREIVWERNGRPVTRPSLPERDQFYCYWLCMEDLLQADQRDDRLVAELRRSLSGGYDLKALRQDGPFELRSRIGQNEARRLREAEKALREVEAAYETLRREEARIPSLEAGIEAARRAGANARLLEQALVLLDAQLERQGIEAGLAEFPSNMAQLRGDERERLQVLDSKREELRPDIEGRLQVRDAAQRRLLETGLIEERPARAATEAVGTGRDSRETGADRAGWQPGCAAARSG